MGQLTEADANGFQYLDSALSQLISLLRESGDSKAESPLDLTVSECLELKEGLRQPHEIDLDKWERALAQLSACEEGALTHVGIAEILHALSRVKNSSH